MSSKIAIEANDLVKNYVSFIRRGIFGRRRVVVEALKGVSFGVLKGEVFGLLGPNGAGKTTTVKILCTLLLPDSGTATILGYDVVKDASKVRRIIGVSLTVEKGFYWKLTGKENLKYFGMLYGLDGKFLEDRVNMLLELVGLRKLGVEDKLYEEYSLGMKARLSLARALLTDPPVIILDEPTLGLDPPSARCLREMLVKLAHEEGKTVLMTTHNMFEAEMVCDRVAIIDRGEIIVMGTVDELKKRVAGSVGIEMFVLTSARASLDSIALKIREGIGVPCSIVGENGGYRIKIVSPSDEVDEVTSRTLRILHDHKCSVRRIEVKEPTLEDVFIKLTGRTGF